MDITLTHLDSTKSARELIPNTDPATGVTVFTGRPGKSADRAFATTRDFLGGFGVRDDIAGGGRSVSDDVLHIRARLAAFETRLVVVRHADMLHPFGNTDLLDILADVVTGADARLALTCDDVAGGDLAGWVEARGGRVHDDDAEMLGLLPSTTPREPTGIRGDFPASVPRGDFYVFRARARDLLTAEEFAAVDAVYLRTAKGVLTNPFIGEVEAGDRLLALCQTTENPAEVVTMIRAAQAAMFRHSVLLKVDLDHFLRLVPHGEHRPLSQPELRALRAYRGTWRPAAVVLLDAGLSVDAVAALRVSEVNTEGDIAGLPLSVPSQEVLRVHSTYLGLLGAQASDPLVPVDPRRISTARRDAAIDLGIPGDTPNRSREDKAHDRFRGLLGVSLRQLDINASPPSTDQGAA